MQDVIWEKRSDGVALITLNRPEVLNALGGELPRLFVEAFADFRADPAVRCVAITGAGRGFCAGGDVRGMGSMLDGGLAGAPAADDIEGSIAMFRKFQDDLITTVHAFPKPTVALVNGPAAGGGMGLALACDLRVASEKARFVTAFRNIGLSDDCGVAYFLERIAGRAVALELLYLSEPVDASRALALGLVNRVTSHDALMTQGMALAAEIAKGPTASLARMKANVTFAETAPLSAVLEREAVGWKIGQLGPDHREAVAAFMEGRKPSFSGG
ncbi:MAG TPA: enoyl-CoA hydratase-related protein [Polyangiaceae bacterium]|nr:enoyl-CoA hydratase-related protein [Polyangiaceae bacterium]